MFKRRRDLLMIDDNPSVRSAGLFTAVAIPTYFASMTTEVILMLAFRMNPQVSFWLSIGRVEVLCVVLWVAAAIAWRLALPVLHMDTWFQKSHKAIAALALLVFHPSKA